MNVDRLAPLIDFLLYSYSPLFHELTFRDVTNI